MQADRHPVYIFSNREHWKAQVRRHLHECNIYGRRSTAHAQLQYTAAAVACVRGAITRPKQHVHTSPALTHLARCAVCLSQPLQRPTISLLPSFAGELRIAAAQASQLASATPATAKLNALGLGRWPFLDDWHGACLASCGGCLRLRNRHCCTWALQRPTCCTWALQRPTGTLTIGVGVLEVRVNTDNSSSDPFQLTDDVLRRPLVTGATTCSGTAN